MSETPLVKVLFKKKMERELDGILDPVEENESENLEIGNSEEENSIFPQRNEHKSESEEESFLTNEEVDVEDVTQKRQQKEESNEEIKSDKKEKKRNKKKIEKKKKIVKKKVRKEVKEPTAEVKNEIILEEVADIDFQKYILEKYKIEGIAFVIALIVFELFFIIFSFGFLKNGADEFLKNMEYSTINITDVNGTVLSTTTVPTSTDDNFDTYYHMYIEVCIMIFLGFGLLMSFLKRFGWFAAGIAFLIAVVSCQLAIVCVGIAHWAYTSIDQEEVDHWYIEVDLSMMILTMFAGGATLISMGALIGKLTPFQFILMILIEIPIYALNGVIVESWIEVQDVGGSYLVHTFGAYFGLAVSIIASKRVLCEDSKAEDKNSTNRVSNYASIVGTIVLWMLWPSFNGAMAGDLRHRVVINTYTSLVGCCIAAFIFSRLFRGKFGMEDLQNATLAGGVAIGATANMEIPIGVPLCIGIAAGIISCVGYRWLSGFLQKIHLHDTCSVHNLHGMPGLVGAFASCIATIWYNDDLPHEDWTPLVQFAGIFITLTFAIVSGLLTGLLLYALFPVYPKKDTEYYEDVAYFEAESDIVDEA